MSYAIFLSTLKYFVCVVNRYMNHISIVKYKNVNLSLKLNVLVCEPVCVSIYFSTVPRKYVLSKNA